MFVLSHVPTRAVFLACCAMKRRRAPLRSARREEGARQRMREQAAYGGGGGDKQEVKKEIKKEIEEAQAYHVQDARRAAIVEMERKRLLKEYATKFRGFLPKGVLQNEQELRDVFGDEFADL